MKPKKSIKTNLESKRTLYFEIGAAITLVAALCAFEWANKEEVKLAGYYNEQSIDEVEVLTPVTWVDKKPKPKPPVVPKIEIVDEDVEIDEPDLNFDVDIDGNDDLIFDIPNEKAEEPEEIGFFYNPEVKPTFQGGGLSHFRNYLMQNIEFPEESLNMGMGGIILLNFMVDEKGNVTHINLLRGLDPHLNEEVVSVLKNSPKWTPGMQGKKPVKVMFNLPVRFVIQ